VGRVAGTTFPALGRQVGIAPDMKTILIVSIGYICEMSMGKLYGP
jgi:hypothetical protein